jgi:hypothetical protein
MDGIIQGRKPVSSPPLFAHVSLSRKGMPGPGVEGARTPKILISIQGQTLNNVGSSPVIFVISSLLPWSTICCYLTGHKQCINIKIFSGQGADEYMQNVAYRKVLEK